MLKQVKKIWVTTPFISNSLIISTKMSTRQQQLTWIERSFSPDSTAVVDQLPSAISLESSMLFAFHIILASKMVDLTSFSHWEYNYDAWVLLKNGSADYFAFIKKIMSCLFFSYVSKFQLDWTDKIYFDPIIAWFIYVSEPTESTSVGFPSIFVVPLTCRIKGYWKTNKAPYVVILWITISPAMQFTTLIYPLLFIRGE